MRFLRVGFLILFLITVIWWSAAPIGTGDVFMYLSLARHFLNVDFFPAMDPFIAQNLQFHLHHEWLSYFYFFAGFKLWGLQGVILAKVFLSSFLFLSLAYFAQRFQNVNWALLPILVLCAFAVAPRLGERAYLFSDLFLILVFGFLCLFEKDRNRKWLLFLPGIFLLWVQFHPGFPLGLALFGLFLVLRFFTFTRKENGWLWLTLFAAVLFTCVNPVGVQGFLYPFQKFLDPQWDIYRQINSEWMPTYHSVHIPTFSKICLLILGCASFLVSGLEARKKNLFPLAGTVVMAVLAWQSMRFTTSAALSFAMIWVTARTLEEAGHRIRRNRFLSIPAAVLSGVLTLAFSFFVFQKPEQGLIHLLQQTPQAYGPEKAWQTLKSRPAGVVFAEWDWNSILSWWGDGKFKVVVHGHVDNPVFAVTNFLSITRSVEDFNRIVKDNKIRYFLLSPETLGDPKSLLSTMLLSPEWKIISRDSFSVLLEKNESDR